MAELSAAGLVKRFDGVTALEGVDLHAAAGQVVGVLGPNGAGKSTLLACLGGEISPDAGRVLLDGRDVTRLPPEERARRGLGRTFQRVEVFPTMTVAEHLRVALEQAGRSRSAAGRGGDLVDEAVERCGLARFLHAHPDELPVGVLRRVELARALCARAQVLLLDEAASGLDEQELQRLEALVAELAAQGRALVLVEHDAALLARVSTTLVALDAGRVVAVGQPAVVLDDDRVRSRYLGATA